MDSNSTRTNSLQLRQRAENAYRRAMNRISRQIEDKLRGLDDPDEILTVVNQFINGSEMQSLCQMAANQMATVLAVGEKSSWRQAAASSTKGRTIFRALKKEMQADIGERIQDIIARNAWKIKTVSIDLAQELSKMSNEGYQAGKRASEIAKEMRKLVPQYSKNHAQLVARTETAKASTALVEARSERLNLPIYTWRTARDGDRVRASHQVMEGVICKWSDPPDPEALAGKKSYGPYHPGCIFNCRCIAIPIIAIQDVPLPARVYDNGQLRTIGTYKELEVWAAA